MQCLPGASPGLGPQPRMETIRTPGITDPEATRQAGTFAETGSQATHARTQVVIRVFFVDTAC